MPSARALCALTLVILLAVAAGAAAAEPGAAPAKELGVYRWWVDPVIWALIIYSIATIGLIGERVLARLSARSKSAAMAEQLQPLLAKPDRAKLAEAFDASDAPLAQAMGHVLKHDVSDSPETTLLLLDDALDGVLAGFRKYLILLAALAGTAPFLGLLGTVFGIIRVFTDIRAQGLGTDTTIVAAGISQALWTTAIGLVIAIPAFIAYNLLSDSANTAVRDLRQQANRVFVALGDL
ncbi:MAG TPA: MotA/TolQ/ExbB proton channel family protein [Phycisphaerae bacterium]|nr:MotA/TolQ/ExbB proton channel family protein [Phycisphaerae bacterium]